MMCRSRRAALMALVLALAACTSEPEPDVPAGTAEPSTAATADTGTTPPPGTPTPPPGEVAVEVFTEVSRVTTETLDVERSSVEVQIEAILSEFETAQSDEGSVVTLGDQVLFDFDSAALKPEAGATLDRIAEALVLAGERRVTIRGHTDARGEDDYNLDLSLRRAAAVRDYFVNARGLGSQRFEAIGLGESEPVAPNELPDGSDDPEGRQRNRRVEIVLQDA